MRCLYHELKLGTVEASLDTRTNLVINDFEPM